MDEKHSKRLSRDAFNNFNSLYLAIESLIWYNSNSITSEGSMCSMAKVFNVTGNCIPRLHYMVDLTSRLEVIKGMVDAGQYITINRGRQYGKTTTLMALEQYLSDEYYVLNMDFQTAMSTAKFKDESTFSAAFADAFTFLFEAVETSGELEELLSALQNDKPLNMIKLFRHLSRICKAAVKPIVLLIDEVDQASNNQVFLDFLAQLRGAYIRREKIPTFQSVILAGVHDIRNLQIKIRPDEEHKHNSPWNIADALELDMSFSPEDIAGMLNAYEADYHTGMDIKAMAQMIYDDTSGYPVLVSTYCRMIDRMCDTLDDFPDRTAAWTKRGFLQAEKQIYTQRMPLFESLINKLETNEHLRELVYKVLFYGERIAFNIYDATIGEAVMYGFLKNVNGVVTVANRIFQNTLYEWFLSQEYSSEMANVGSKSKPLFVQNGHLNMELVLEKFVQYFHDIYGDKTERFIENDGRKLFLLYLRPIINGVGNYYIEAQTRDLTRTDVVVDYLGEQFVIEMKIWHGKEYNERGEKQLAEYLDYYHISKGYLLSFSFNQNKEIGTHTIQLGDKMIFEAIV